MAVTPDPDVVALVGGDAGAHAEISEPSIQAAVMVERMCGEYASLIPTTGIPVRPRCPKRRMARQDE